MIHFIGFFVKAYIVVLLLRWVLTQQELTFNMVGRSVAKFTNFFAAGKPKVLVDRLTPAIIIVITFIYGLLVSLFSNGFFQSMRFAFVSVISFITLFFIICILLGSLASPGTGTFPLFFYRLGNIWVQIVRKVIRIRSNLIVIPAIALLGLFYVASVTLVEIVVALVAGLAINPPVIVGAAAVSLLFDLVSLLRYLAYVIMVRALLSWVSPDPHNLVVQLVYYITEPVISLFRRFVPPIGPVDLSALVAMIALFFVEGVIRAALLKFFVL